MEIPSINNREGEIMSEKPVKKQLKIQAGSQIIQP